MKKKEDQIKDVFCKKFNLKKLNYPKKAYVSRNKKTKMPFIKK
jgi:hypothetical protein